jgi:uncharacterized protein YndB with AHSA1/START domain
MAEKKKRSVTESEKGEFVISRVFDAPRELVFKAQTESERLEQWWGAKGFTTRVIKLDFRPGGVFHYSMQTPDGHEMWGKFVYREIVAPERIVFINSFADKEGNTIQAPFSLTWPMEVMNTMTFSERAGKTTLTIRSIPFNATKEERETFEVGSDSMRQGFNGSLDRLADYLARG